MSIEKLLATNVNAHTEKKNNLTYLSWAWAWTEALKADPTATFKVETFEETGANGGKRTVPYMNINGTAMVWVTVTMFNKPMTCQLPVIDYRNKPIVEPNAFDVNTAIMRCMTKALGLHGLGLYIYAGEDIPNAIVIGAKDGIGDDLPQEWKDYLVSLASEMSEWVIKQKNPAKAKEILAKAMADDGVEGDMLIYLDRQLDSKVRTALRSA